MFWIPRKKKAFDLRKRFLLEANPRHFWKKKVLKKNECISLKPGELLLGRISFKLNIPCNCAGKIEGRSSFSRLGLGVHCTCDFLNPGYTGHMPLQLFNYGRNTIKLFPYLPICQLMLIKLSQKPEKLYGHEELQSKYMDDDGGPSYWWRDKRIKKLQETFSSQNIELRIEEEILPKIGVSEPDILERFEKFVIRKHKLSSENAETLLDAFSKKEKRLKLREKIFQYFAKFLFPTLFATLIGYFIYAGSEFSVSIALFSVFTVVSFFPFFLALKEPKKEYCTPDKIEEN